jgi:iron complex outermembrane receptor protein
MPAGNLNDLLNQTASADIRSRGADGIQADLSMRGGNFDQTLVLLNGIALNDVQTGHHTLNLPLSLNDIERIEILQGPGNRFYGLNAYSGAVNIVSRSRSSNPLSISAHYGSNDRLGGSLSGGFGNQTFSHRVSAEYRQSNGYLQNREINNTDYQTANIFYSGKADIHFSELLLNAGFTHKAFGANDFYTPAFPWQYEVINTGFASVQSSFGEKIKWSPAVYFRRHQDRFELFREDVYQRQDGFFINEEDTAGFGGGYYYSGHNYHLTQTWGGKLTARMQTAFGKSSFGADLRSEHILSNVLGEEMNESRSVPGSKYGRYTKQGNRERINMFAEHYIRSNAFAFSGGMALAVSNGFEPLLTGGADVSYKFSDEFKAYLSFNRSARLPSFTDLYYSGPTNEGNPDLKPETAITYELGLKKQNRSHLFYLNGFMRYGNNTIDWAKAPAEDIWKSRNITRLKTKGLETGARIRFPEHPHWRYLNASYNFTDSEVLDNTYISKYVLDYLRHQAVVGFSYQMKRFILSWNTKWEDRAGSYTDYDTEGFPETNYKPFFLADAKLMYRTRLFDVYAEITNIFDSEYHEIASVIMPGRRFLVGFEWRLSVKSDK